MGTSKELRRRLRRARRAWHAAEHSGEVHRAFKLTGEAGRIRLEITKARRAERLAPQGV